MPNVEDETKTNINRFLISFKPFVWKTTADS